MENTNSTTTPSSLALSLGGAALTLGVLADVLFRRQSLGINAVLWTGALAVAIATLSAFNQLQWHREGRWLLLPALIFAGAVALRASPVLQAMNAGAVILILAAASFRLRGGSVRFGSVTEYAWSVLCLAAAIGAGFAAMIPAIPWRRAPVRRGPAVAILRGLALALPLVILFGALFVAADAVFSNILRRGLEFHAGSVASHFVWVALGTWISAGVLRGLLVDAGPPAPAAQPPPFLRLGPVEVTTVLGLLDVLFLLFVAVQVRYLFGSAAHVQASVGLTYAEYARQGFFQLLAVAALVLPVILTVHWLLRDSSPHLRLAFRLLAATLVLLLFAVVASALERMRAYVGEFGLTQLRLYSTVFMIWLVIVFLWLLATAFREQRRRFAVGAAVAGLAAVAALNLANPAALIVRTNVRQASAEHPFDVAYATSLGPDATPTVIAALNRMAPGDACLAAAAVVGRSPGDQSWQSWNWSRQQASASVRDHDDELRAACPDRSSP
jgi:hypothetical protein